MTLDADDRFVGRVAVNAVGRAVVGVLSRATPSPGDRTMRTVPRPGRTRAAMPGMIGLPQDGTEMRQSVVIPTFNERENVEPLLRRLAEVLPVTGTEILFVDDSTDDTPDVIRAAAQHCPIQVTVHHRENGTGGLGGAVVEGMRLTRGDWVVVMDADLQHPPEVVPDLIAAGMRDGADLVIGTRYAGGGTNGGLSDRYRRIVSSASTMLTKLIFRTALLRVSDPMSGLFAVRTSSLDVERLRPLGYKILLELVVRNRPGRIVEMPYSFQQRHAGDSKSTMAEGIRFLRHLALLRFGAQRLRMLAFALIGLSGLLPNQLTLWLLTVAGVHYVPAALMANLVAVAWNFALTDTLLYRHRRHGRLPGRVARFFLMGHADLVLRIPLLAVLVDGVHLGVLVANLVTLVTSFVVRFLVSEKVIYRSKPGAVVDLSTPETA